MKKRVLSLAVLLLCCLCKGSLNLWAQTNLVTLAGGENAERFTGLFQLSDGSILVGGQADDLNWLPPGTPVTTLNIPGNGFASTTTGIAFLMRLSSDQQTVLRVLKFPDNTVRDIAKIRTNTAPGQPTGDLYISGNLAPGSSNTDWYFIGRLDNNFLNGDPTGLEFYREVNTRGRNPSDRSMLYPDLGNESVAKQYQVWDVGSNGIIFYATGADISFDSHGIDVMNRNGQDTLVDYFPLHSTGNQAPGFQGIPASAYINNTGNPRFDLRRSNTWFKFSGTGVPGSFRSFTRALYDTLMTDENGNPGRKGFYPFDAFFNGPQLLFGNAANNAGPGYTGYSHDASGGKWTARISGITIDRRTNDLVVAVSLSSTSNNNIPGFKDSETAIACMRNNGQMRWWARLHKEDTRNSPAEQHIEGIEIDYANNQLVVVGRTRGDAVNNFWNGNQLADKPGGNGFQNMLTGDKPVTNPLDYSWLGKYDITTGKIKHATYVAELAADAALGQASQQQLLDGWPSLNAYAAQLGQTRVNAVHVNPLNGEVAILATAGRTITTANAFQKMLKPGDPSFGNGVAPLNAFVRVYNSSLDTLRYSSLLTGIWNPSTGLGADNTVLRSVMARNGGVMVSGFHKAEGNDVPTSSVPAWGTAQKSGIGGLFANLRFNCQAPAQPGQITGPADVCAGNELTFQVAPVTGATRYSWFINAAGWTGTSTTNSITLTRPGTSNGGSLFMVAQNNCGVSLQRLVNLPRSTNLVAPVVSNFPTDHCLNSTRSYGVNVVQGATVYNWSLSGAGCAGFTLGSASTSGNFVDVTRTTVTSPCTLNVQVGGCGTPSSTVGFPLPDANINTPATPSFLNTPITICKDISKVVSVNPVVGATSYTWTLNGTGWSGSSIENSIELKGTDGASALELRVVANGSCGNSTPGILNIAAPIEGSIPQPPAAIIGFVDGHCNSETRTYSIVGQTGQTYNWSLSNTAWTLDTTAGTEVGLTAPAVGSAAVNIAVKATNQCGTSNPILLNVQRGAPAQPANFSFASITVCGGQSITLRTNLAVGATYSWTLPNGWIGTSTTNEITITASPGAGSGNLGVVAMNRCGSSPVRNLAISANGGGSPRILTVSVPEGSGEINACVGTARTAWVTANDDTDITGYIWEFPPGWTFINASSKEPSNDTIRFSPGANAAPGIGRVTLLGINGVCGSATFELVPGLRAPGQITGTRSLCNNPVPGTYSIAPLPGADSYQWVLQPESAATLDVSADGLSVTVNWNAGFAGNVVLRVRGISPCGTGLFSPAAEISIGVAAPTAESVVRCGAGEVQLTATGAPAGGTYTWFSQASGGNVIGNGATITLNVTANTTVYVSASNSEGCESITRTPVNITVTTIPIVAIQAPSQTTFCNSNQPIQLIGTPSGGSFSGSSGVNSTGLFTPSQAAIGENKVYYNFSAGVGCNGIDSVTLTVNVAPIIDPPLPNVSVCANGAPVSLNTPGGGSWSGTGISANTFTPQAGQGGTVITATYSFTLAGCTATQNVSISVVAPPTVSAGANEQYCQSAQAVTLTGSPTGGTWTPGSTFNPSGQPLNTPIRYIYSFTDGATTCSASDTVFFTVIANPTVAIGAQDTTVCANVAGYQLLTPLNGVWSGSPGVSSSGLFNPSSASPGLNVLTCTVTNGACVATATKNITVNPVPVLNVGADTSVCSNAAAYQLPTPGLSGSWSGSTAVSTSGFFTPSQVTGLPSAVSLTYTAIVEACAVTATKTINVSPAPSVTIGADTSVCASVTAFNLSASPIGGVWSGGSFVNASGQFDPSQVAVGATVSVSYSVTSGGCSATSSRSITVNAEPSVSFSQTSFNVCKGATLQLSGASPGGGLWSGNGATATGLFSSETLAPGNYSIIYTVGPVGCAGQGTVTVSINALPNVDAGDDKTIQIGESVRLGATGSAGNIVWSPANGLSATNILTPEANPTETITYTITITSDKGCVASDAVTVAVNSIAILVPKGFTPNNDGDNDRWIIPNIDRYPGNKVKVFNRWGAEVFSRDGYSNTNPWTGDNLPTGTYYYLVEPGIGEKTLSGTITILK